MDVSPIKLEIFRNRLESICDEMIYALIRTAYSTNIKDRMDCSCAVCNNEGEVIAQTEMGTPVHLGTMSFAVRRLIKERSLQEMHNGDVFLFNNPYPEGPGHLPDITVITPIFHEEKIVGFATSQAHNVDVGGIQPGSTPFGVTEIYQEGLQIPIIRIMREGEIDQDLLNLILENVRVPEMVEGDVWAEIAANNKAVSRMHELINKYGWDEVENYSLAILDYAEKRMEKGIESIANGVYEFADIIEGDSISNGKITIRVKIIKESDNITLDFTETDDQVQGPINCRPSLVAACSYYAIKSLVDPDLPANGGAYRPIKIKTRPQSLLEADYPAPLGNANGITTQRIVDTVWGAMAKAIPNKINAASSGTITGCTIGGYDSIRKRYFTYVETYGGGQGGMEGQDGMNGVHTHMSNTRNSPVEVLENEYPFLITSYSLRKNSGGSGKYRGGLGLKREIKFLAGDLRYTLSSDREKIHPWGLNDGKNGKGTEYILQTKSESKQLPVKYSGHIKKPGTKLIVKTAGGGGYGKPEERSLDDIKNDIKKDYIDEEYAQKYYEQYNNADE